MRTRLSAALLLVLLAVCARETFAQSLADVARKEEERRKTIPEPAKVYTNKDLGAVPSSSAAAPAPATLPDNKEPADPGAKKDVDSTRKDADAHATDANGKDASGKDGAGEAHGGTAVGKDGEKGQKYWAGRKKTLQEQLDRDQVFADALQSRINALKTDFVNRDDPVQRSAIDRDRQKALSELGQLSKKIQDDKKALADLDDEARRAGVPPGWLR